MWEHDWSSKDVEALRSMEHREHTGLPGGASGSRSLCGGRTRWKLLSAPAVHILDVLGLASWGVCERV